jgi:hypothetical protein
MVMRHERSKSNTDRKRNKKFWEELIVYFLRYNMDHTENEKIRDTQQGDLICLRNLGSI